ncbi:sulfotransferase [Luedemannella helvata]|uniref:Sulfotransferase n=1 Tax=Luedemannella helvata TaxID=349315 RepID=A0ABN2JQ99_9ACTN
MGVVVVRVLFLGGLGRSGTTLLERVLGCLPGVCTLGEVVHLWRRDLIDDERCGCGQAFSACGFWHEVGKRAFGGWDRLDPHHVLRLQSRVERTRHIPSLAGRTRNDDARDYALYYARVYAAAAEVTGANVVVDSSKHASLAYCLRHAPNIDLRVAHVVRDARGVAYSWTKTVTRPESDRRETMTRYSPGRAALLWSAHNAAFGLLGARGVAVRRFRYEEFVADPRGVSLSIAAFAGLDLHTGALDFLTEGADGSVYADLPPAHSAAGNPMRFRTGPVEVRADESWRTALPPRQRRLVAAIAAPLHGAYGYPITGRRT